MDGPREFLNLQDEMEAMESLKLDSKPQALALALNSSLSFKP